ncbi:Fe2+ or Zn2+ uptake regulation protein [Desulfitispora alkaliphila]|uniref:Fur family transcriptional regulator n=1 Tax=Desulfitispora alkaliphila TaxID=622674 RepID=UPI003D249512
MKRINAEQLLKKARFRTTPGRVALIDILINAEEPLTQQEIMEKFSKIQMNYVSVYRALEAFVQRGILHKIEGVDRVWRFAINNIGNEEQIHPHFICKSCGKTECLRRMEIPTFQHLKQGYIIEEQEILLKGLCNSCVK